MGYASRVNQSKIDYGSICISSSIVQTGFGGTPSMKRTQRQIPTDFLKSWKRVELKSVRSAFTLKSFRVKRSPSHCQETQCSLDPGGPRECLKRDERQADPLSVLSFWRFAFLND